MYGYDAVGSYKRDEYGCMGSGQNFIMPLLDNLVSILNSYLSYLILFALEQIGHKNRLDEKKQLSEEEVVNIVKELFVVASERDIYTGDNVEIKIIRKSGIRTEVFPLKKD